MKYFFLLICLAFCNCMKAQSTEDSVRSTVNQLFAALNNVDTALLVSSFTDSGILQRIVDKKGKTQVETEGVADLASQLVKMQKNVFDERFQFDVIKIDGPMAFVWAPFKFYHQGKFDHCGTDSYLLVRIDGKWKIQYVIDTKRSQDCE